jgi:hypothetical protein
MSCGTSHIRLRYRVYVELRCVLENGNFVFADHRAQTGLGVKAWVEV